MIEEVIQRCYQYSFQQPKSTSALAEPLSDLQLYKSRILQVFASDFHMAAGSGMDAPRYVIRPQAGKDSIEGKSRSNALDLQYLAEGAANVVFSTRCSMTSEQLRGTKSLLNDPSGHGVDVKDSPFAEGKVLRFSKGAKNSPDCKMIMKTFYADIQPLFEDPTHFYESHLLEPFAVSVDKRLMDSLNDAIIANRHSRFTGRIPDNEDQFALVLDDMSSIPGSALTIEVKPKWLAQSPNATPGANRCRTCAMQAQNVSKNASKTEAYICPLRLASGKGEAIRPWIEATVATEAALHNVPKSAQASIVDSMIGYFAPGEEGNRLLMHLRRLQTSRDPYGVHERDIATDNGRWRNAPDGMSTQQLDHNLCIAMTLRDCSLYVRVHYGGRENHKVESKLGDLDLKDIGKITDWHDKESILIDDGWYTASHTSQEETCELSLAEKCLLLSMAPSAG